MSDSECLALVLRTGSVGRSAEALGHVLLERFGGLDGVAAATLTEVGSVRGVGPVRAASLGAAFGLARRLTERRYRPGERIQNAADVARIVRDVTRGAQRESFFSLLLDARHRVVALRMVSTGELSATPVHPREVFTAAIRESAAALVVAHNHPSGDATPSAQDRAVTERLREVSQLVGIELLDHVVVGRSRYFSFAEAREAAIG